MKREKVTTFVTLDENTSIQQLGLIDQFRAIAKKLSHKEDRELKRFEVETKDFLTKKANLMDFLLKATDPIRKGDHRKVHIKVPSEYKDVIKEVLESPRFKPYYYYKYRLPMVRYDVSYKFDLWLEVK